NCEGSTTVAGEGGDGERLGGGFVVVRRLGGGGVGGVHQAPGRSRKQRGGVQNDRPPGAAAPFPLQNAIPPPAGVPHPNRVQLHELFAEGRETFFTMELVEGIDFLRYVRAPGPLADAAGEAPTEALDRGARAALDDTLPAGDGGGLPAAPPGARAA